MKYTLFVLLVLLNSYHATAQKKYDIGRDDYQEWKSIQSASKYEGFIDRFNGMFGGWYNILTADTTWALSLVYRGGREYYARYFNHKTKRMEEPQYANYTDTVGREMAIALPEDSVKAYQFMEYVYNENTFKFTDSFYRKKIDFGDLSNIDIDTAWLYKHVRHLKVNFWSEYNGIYGDDWAKRDKADSLDFIKEWDLFVQHLGKFKNLEHLILIISPTLITHYLDQEFHLPSAITSLKKLREVEIEALQFQNFVGIPMELFRIKKLNSLTFRDISYRNIELIASLKHLKHLDLSCSMLGIDFPMWLYDLKNLETLRLDINLVAYNNPSDSNPRYHKRSNSYSYAIPNGINKLSKLKYLSIGMTRGVNVISIPIDEICTMKKLNSISIYSNSLFANEKEKEKIRKSIETYHFGKTY